MTIHGLTPRQDVLACTAVILAVCGSVLAVLGWCAG